MDWREYGQRTAALLAQTAHGDRERELEKLAIDSELNLHTLRRAATALAALERLKALGSDFPQHKLLEGAPITVVEIAARWQREDAAAAGKCLDDWAKEKRPVSWVQGQFKSRAKTGKKLRGRQLKDLYLDSITTAVLKAVEKHFLDSGLANEDDLDIVTPAQPNDAAYLSADFVTFRFRHAGEYIGVVVVGPYQNPSFYHDRMPDWISRAFALSWMYELVFIALPLGAPAKEYRDSCRKFRSKAPRAPEVHVAVLDVPTQTEPWP